MSIYKEEILEHYKNPQNFVEFTDADIIVEKYNPLCGDKQKWYIKLSNVKSKMPSVEAVGFIGDGCAISIAASSMLSEYVKHKTLEEMKDMNEDDMIQLFGTRVSHARMKCLMLGLQAVMKGIKNYESGK